jgi:hypothetical protein
MRHPGEQCGHVAEGSVEHHAGEQEQQRIMGIGRGHGPANVGTAAAAINLQEIGG